MSSRRSAGTCSKTTWSTECDGKVLPIFWYQEPSFIDETVASDVEVLGARSLGPLPTHRAATDPPGMAISAPDILRTLKQRVARPQGIRWRQHLGCISRQAVDFKTCQKALLLVNEDTAQVGFISEEKICNNVETTCLIRCAYDGQIYGRAAAAAPPIRS